MTETIRELCRKIDEILGEGLEDLDPGTGDDESLNEKSE